MLRLASLAAIFLFTPTLLAQDRASPEPDVYGHVGAGAGMAFLISSDIESATEGFSVQRFGFSPTLLAHAGLRNIAQIEFRKVSDGYHDLVIQDFDSQTGEIVTLAEVPLDYRSEQWLLKVNPLFWATNLNFFLVGGISSATLHDEIDDGWDGDGFMVGLELGIVRQYFDGSISLTRNQLDLETLSLADFPIAFPVEASRYVLLLSVGIGVGF